MKKRTQWQRKGWDVKKLIKKVCDYFEIDPVDIVKKGRQNELSNAKSLICYWGIQTLGISSTEIANNLDISQPAISKASKRGAEYSELHGIEWEDVVNH